ncbi:MAG: type II toxin-antitoxin system RelE/ParE family toxin [Ignavibacteriaceae bacterium]|jgi:mRNA interferase RelE/StbE|nr:type II toxin-antitoxin system RelE/ParE family toxin [Ignavibacteriaceae bacterium]
MYSLEFKEVVLKEFKQIPVNEKNKLWTKIQQLKSDPRPIGCRKLVGRDSDYRIRYGNYRVIYQINEIEKKIIIIQVGHRKDIYR